MTHILDLDADVQRDIFGSKDSYIRKIEKDLKVAVVARDGVIKVTGDEADVRKAVGILENLAGLSKAGGEILDQSVDYAIEMQDEAEPGMLADFDKEIICHTVSGRPVKPKTLGQKKYIDSIRSNLIVFANGPAGTGKTFLAMAMAITAFQNKEVERIIMTRPAIEAGEKLGFLPGDLQSKVDPYLRPLYDALYEMLGTETYQKYMERGNIEVAPLAYMRGRTLDDSFIILDEAQNTSREQMKMFLTRLGFGSKMVITGDITQIDLPADKQSGLKVAMRVLDHVEDIGICCLTGADVIRHQLVQRIIEAYDAYDSRNPQPAEAASRRKYVRKKP